MGTVFSTEIQHYELVVRRSSFRAARRPGRRLSCAAAYHWEIGFGKEFEKILKAEMGISLGKKCDPYNLCLRV
jgi:hypothetical protein